MDEPAGIGQRFGASGDQPGEVAPLAVESLELAPPADRREPLPGSAEPVDALSDK